VRVDVAKRLLESEPVSGSPTLAAAGLLDGLTATTRWRAMRHLEKLGAVPVTQRVVEQLPRA
jgi:transcriptional regulator GlxA family with amidase domain